MFEITNYPIPIGQLKMTLDSPEAGAISTFEGIVRNHNDGHQVEYLEYEAHEGLCIKEAQIIFDEAWQKFDILDFRCAHRVGRIDIGEVAVWIGVSAAHRDHAFKACRYIIDEVKLRLPIWKKEHYIDGQHRWIKSIDPATLKR